MIDSCIIKVINLSIIVCNFTIIFVYWTSHPDSSSRPSDSGSGSRQRTVRPLETVQCNGGHTESKKRTFYLCYYHTCNILRTLLIYSKVRVVTDRVIFTNYWKPNSTRDILPSLFFIHTSKEMEVSRHPERSLCVYYRKKDSSTTTTNRHQLPFSVSLSLPLVFVPSQ